MRAQLLCLPYYLQAPSLKPQASGQAPSPKSQADHLAQRVSYAWAGLSGACHQHPYELPPTSAELLGWLGTVEELVADIGARESRRP